MDLESDRGQFTARPLILAQPQVDNQNFQDQPRIPSVINHIEDIIEGPNSQAPLSFASVLGNGFNTNQLEKEDELMTPN